MIRKQLYIREEHDRALKLKAGELGISETELVRRLLDGLLFEERGAAPFLSVRANAVLAFLEERDRISSSHTFSAGYRFDREELYEEREASFEKEG